MMVLLKVLHWFMLVEALKSAVAVENYMVLNLVLSLVLVVVILPQLRKVLFIIHM